MIEITQTMVEAAKENARLHGFTQPIDDELAAEFVQWYHALKLCSNTELEAIVVGLSGSAANGYEQQRQWWTERLGGIA